MTEQITDFLASLKPWQIREYRQRLQELDQALRAEIKNSKRLTPGDKNQGINNGATRPGTKRGFPSPPLSLRPLVQTNERIKQ